VPEGEEGGKREEQFFENESDFPQCHKMDEMVRQLTTTDTKKKLAVGQQLIDHLGDPDSSMECEDFGVMVDGLVPWMQSSNFKVGHKSMSRLSTSEKSRRHVVAITRQTVVRTNGSPGAVR
jgi:hypothetical protein